MVVEAAGIFLRELALSRVAQGLLGALAFALTIGTYTREPVAGAILFASLALAATSVGIFFVWRRTRVGNPFAVIDYLAQWTIEEPDGHDVVYLRRLKVRVLRNNTYAMRDQVWGDGTIGPAQADPGRVCDEFSDDDGRRTAVISLGEVKHRGDTGTYSVTRRIEGVFAEDPCFVQVEALADTRRLEIRVVFPRQRPPDSASFTRQRARHRREPLTIKGRPDGRQEVSKVVTHPARDELLTLSWQWPPSPTSAH